MATAGILVIGNEILSGKVVDTNSPYLCRELRTLGVDVERIITIPDRSTVIAEHVRAMHKAYDFVFTSGGIGPTHDDMTIDGIAAAFGAPARAQRVDRGRGSSAPRARRPNASQLKMAQVPAGATLIDAGDLWFPLVVVENVYILPGIPELLRKKFESARERFRGVPFVLKRVYVTRMESEIAEHLHDAARGVPGAHAGLVSADPGGVVPRDADARVARRRATSSARSTRCSIACRRRRPPGGVTDPTARIRWRFGVRASRLDDRVARARAGCAALGPARCAARAPARRPPPRGARARHLRLAKPAVALLLLGARWPGPRRRCGCATGRR